LWISGRKTWLAIRNLSVHVVNLSVHVVNLSVHVVNLSVHVVNLSVHVVNLLLIRKKKEYKTGKMGKTHAIPRVCASPMLSPDSICRLVSRSPRRFLQSISRAATARSSIVPGLKMF
jgi:hypothetical protein